MRVVVFANQKGGVGKTTLCGHMGVMADQKQAGPVVLVDGDPQANLSVWWNDRQAQTPLFASADIANLASQLKELKANGVQLVCIDTPAGTSDAIKVAISLADLVVIPTRPSPHDLRALGATIDIAEAHGKRMVFVINGAANRAKLTGQAAVALSQHGTVAPIIIVQRTEFAESMIDGRTVQESNPSGKSAAEVEELWTYLAGQLKKI